MWPKQPQLLPLLSPPLPNRAATPLLRVPAGAPLMPTEMVRSRHNAIRHHPQVRQVQRFPSVSAPSPDAARPTRCTRLGPFP